MTIAFHETRFPTSISRGASGGPERRTDIVAMASGHEERNSRWADSRRKYQAGFGITTIDELHQIVSFFEERRGRLYGFRFKDHTDYKSCQPLQDISATDQELAIADGSNFEFAIIKTYGSSSTSWVRTISKPVAGTVIIAIDGTECQNNEFSVDTSTGIVTFQQDHIPAAGSVVTAGYEFDVPVRFDTDYLQINLDAFRAGQIPDIAIIEIKP